MDLQQIFYAVSITFFFSVWFVMIAAVVALYLLSRQIRDAKNRWQKSVFTKPLTMAAGAVPLMSAIWPVLHSGWQWWKKRHNDSKQ